MLPQPCGSVVDAHLVPPVNAIEWSGKRSSSTLAPFAAAAAIARATAAWSGIAVGAPSSQRSVRVLSVSPSPASAG